MKLNIKMMENIFKMLNVKGKYEEKNFYKEFEKLKKIKYKLPSNINKYDRKILNGCNIFTKYNDNYDKIIIYIHGGAYISDIQSYYVDYLNKLLKNNSYKIVIPQYPLLPNNNYKNSFELLFNLYEYLLKENKDIIIMGDSAGGGLSISFTQYLKKLNIKLPSKLVLFSPWVDVSMDNGDIDKYESVDPILSKYGLKELGKMWANELDVKDYKVSPIYGDLDLPDILLYVGTKEIFYPDNILFFNKLDKSKSKLIVGEGLTHVYPVYPIKEGCETIKEINEFINK